jgi:uncharacterized membrane protein
VTPRLSFIGLGLVLVGIGYLYRRRLFPPRPAAIRAGRGRGGLNLAKDLA